MLPYYLSGGEMRMGGRLLYPLYESPDSRSLAESVARSAREARLTGAAGVSGDGVRLEGLRTYEARRYGGRLLGPVREFCEFVRERMAPYVLDAYIHGSLADASHTGYSDFDTLILLRQETVEDAERLRCFRRLYLESTRFLYDFDPLQHHPHFVLCEASLGAYDESFLPLCVWREAVSVLGRGVGLTFSLRGDPVRIRRRFRASVDMVRIYTGERRRMIANPYYLKALLSHAMLLPALFLQLGGRGVGKRDSFSVIAGLLPPAHMAVLERVSSLRQGWRRGLGPGYGAVWHAAGRLNPLLLPWLAKRGFGVVAPLPGGAVDGQLIDGLAALADYLEREAGCG